MRYYLLFALLLPVGSSVAQSFSETCLTKNTFQDRYASYSPNGKQIVFESDRNENWDIYVMDADGDNQLQLTFSDSSDRQPSWHPNGKKILFESTRNGKNKLYEITLPNKKVSTVELDIRDDQTPIFARYSPNGKYIGVSLQKNESHSEIAIFNRKGKLIRQLTFFGLRSYYPNWSPAGDKIVFFSRHETNNEDDQIYLINTDGSVLKRIIEGPTHNFCPSISPDGQKVVYAESQENSRPEIFVSEIDGSNKIRVTNNSDGETLPSWSPDGEYLLITAYRNGNYEICRIKLDKW